MSSKTFGLLAASALVLLFAGSALAQEDQGFPSKVAGSWMGEGSYDVDVGCDGSIEVSGVLIADGHTFGVGGSKVATNPANPNSGHGTWVKTGPRQITSRDLNFGPVGANGLPSNRAIISLVVDFDRSFETATTTFEAKVYLWPADPLDPTSVPFVCTSGSHTTFKKVSATE